VIKTLEAQVSHFLLGCKCPVRRFPPDRAKDLSAPGISQEQVSASCELPNTLDWLTVLIADQIQLVLLTDCKQRLYLQS
jgi:hypothetical protein